MIDGRPYQGNLSAWNVPEPKLGKAKRTWQVDLDPGEHTVQVIAESAVSEGRSNKISIRRKALTETLPRLFVPDGTPVETINGRNRLWAVSPWRTAPSPPHWAALTLIIAVLPHGAGETCWPGAGNVRVGRGRSTWPSFIQQIER